MKISNTIISSVIIIILLTTCEKHTNEQDSDLPVLLPNELINISLSNTAEVLPRDLSFNKETNQLSLFDHLKLELIIIDFKNKSLIQTIPFELEGPNGVGEHNFLAHYIHNKDSIYILNKYKNEIILYDRQPKVRARYKIRPEDAPISLPFPDARTLRPFFQYKNAIIMMGISTGFEIHEDHTQVDNLLILDLPKNRLNTALPRPQIYNEGQWGQLIKYLGFFDYIPSKERIVCSLGLDHNIYEYDLKTHTLTTHYTPITVFPEVFVPLRKDHKATGLAKEEMRRYGHTTPTYYSLLYDPYKKVYYRFGTPAQSTDEYLNNEPRGLIMSVLDENFQSKGEWKFPKGYPLKYNCIFIAEGGIYINAVPAEEEQISFYRFDINNQ